MPKSPAAENRKRTTRPDKKIPAGTLASTGAKRKAAEAGVGTAPVEIPPAGKTKAGVKAPPKPSTKSLPQNGAAQAEGRAGKHKRPADKKARAAPRKAFLIAASLSRDGGPPSLQVYAAVVRSAEAALAAVRAEIGEDAALELTGSLSTRMARTLGLKPDEIRQI